MYFFVEPVLLKPNLRNWNTKSRCVLHDITLHYFTVPHVALNSTKLHFSRVRGSIGAHKIESFSKWHNACWYSCIAVDSLLTIPGMCVLWYFMVGSIDRVLHVLHFLLVLWCSLVVFVLESQHPAWSPAQAAKYGEMPYCYASMGRPLEYLQIWVNCRLVTTSHN